MLLDANRTDAEEMVCFMRVLDYDCDGWINEADYCRAMNPRQTRLMDVCTRMDGRWQAAALALEEAPRTGP